jgi:hypothetical protein
MFPLGFRFISAVFRIARLCVDEVKGKKLTLSLYLILCLLCHEGIWKSGGIAPPFLTAAIDGREWSASRFCCFTPGKEPPLDRRVCGPQSRSVPSGRCTKEKNLLPLPGVEPWFSSPIHVGCWQKSNCLLLLFRRIILIREEEIFNQNYWVFGLFPTSGILGSTKHDVSETGSVSVLRCGGGGRHLFSWVP